METSKSAAIAGSAAGSMFSKYVQSFIETSVSNAGSLRADTERLMIDAAVACFRIYY
jgi:hypothetical protein